ncbi:hypothetical protein [Rhodococcoides kyotonense]|uniref:Recombinase n=1 Tax=Rhodococcoides kyotonense TaxID=398843 RepID=A0A177YL01_9NOCA|nr:hypothetical protein [Rhodococcus kyotonensis]OAK56237.1 hypothetical protein A3K89_17335 [Rhodococcus kyotonensis]
MAPTRPATQYRYDWALFVDWCAAAELTSLPATPMTVAEFLDENPAGDAVQRRRVSAINRQHLDADHFPPGSVTSIRLALDGVRSGRIGRLATRLRAIAAVLPTTGTAEALFGRRDAVLLLLAGAGLSFRAIAELDHTDVSVDGPDVWIGGRHLIRIPANTADSESAARIWNRWWEVLHFSDRYPSTSLLAKQLQRSRFPDMGEWPRRPGPVAVPIDQWGHMPFPPTPMTPDAIAAVVHAYLTDIPPRRKARRPSRHIDDENNQDFTETSTTEPVSVDLDPGYYERGVQARSLAHTAMTDVPGLVDDIEDRIEHLLQRTLDLLDEIGAGEL